jgi:hypothetical protein
MSMTDDQDVIHSMTRTVQIIAAAMIAGVVGLLGVAIAIAPILGAPAGAGGAGRPPAIGTMDVGQIITWIAVAFAVVSLPLSFLVSGWIAAQNRRRIAAGKWGVPPSLTNANTLGPPSPFSPEALKSDTGKLAFVYQIQFILGAAITEGLAFFAGVAYMLAKNPIALGLALVLVVAMAAQFPTPMRVASWIDRQQEWLIQDKQAASDLIRSDPTGRTGESRTTTRILEDQEGG